MTYAKQGDRAVYFDSFDNFQSPKEMMRYLNVTQIIIAHLINITIKITVSTND